MQERDTIDRRTFTRRTAAVTGMLALAGCQRTDGESGDGSEPDPEDGDDSDDDVMAVPEVVEVEDPPDAVYVPTHREAMRMLEPIAAGDLRLAPMLSYPHPFWVIAGGGGSDDEVQRVDPDDGRGVHMMFTLWDDESGVVLPIDDGTQLRISRDGEQVGQPRSPWPMISQEMGFHFGDNVSLPEDGTYSVEVTIPPVSTRKTGDLAGRLEEGVTATFEFVYDDEFRHEVVGGVEYLDEEDWGRRGALAPMDHGGGMEDGDHGDDMGGDEHGDGHGHVDDGHHDDHADDSHHDDHEGHHHVPYSALPDVEAYPGTLLLESRADDRPEETADLPRSGDAAFLSTVTEPGFRLADGDERYLLVSPRTPYNRVPLADMSMTVTIERDGEVVAEPTLEQILDSEYGLHYGASIADVRADDTVTITIESPPQVARHRGYETAFLEMEPVELTVPEVQ
ncbi:DUF7350 domain-containing protein [Natrarchaeobius chitinivorans]|uniref:DUF7350 domain-containing protein n=1 Tax=Natrarchaeobius chitinivorans TaxID=1679083 RepID=A0A3N6PEX0_NATCH|nr:hypothetical protein [Natrarchaeobius chitinivorans]RQG95955.1 hypothetical protein EA473_07175 [Natrarchaeobius chitinivorans]